MRRAGSSVFLMIVFSGALPVAATTAARQAGAPYQPVKVCSLLSLAEVKKLAPWPPHLDSFAKAEEEAIPQGSSCNYPTLDVQVMSFRQSAIDSLKKTDKLEPVPGIGDEAYLRNNKDLYGELFARVGPHLLTVQFNIPTGQTFETSKPTVIGLGKAFAARLR